MNLVNILVKRAPVHCTVHPVMPCILQDEKDGDVESYGCPCWERNTGLHTAHFRHWVEEPDLREFDGEMAEEDESCASPLLGGSGVLLPLDLIFVEIWDLVDDDPRKTATEVDDLVHNKAHDSGGKDIILHVLVPTLYQILASHKG